MKYHDWLNSLKKGDPVVIATCLPDGKTLTRGDVERVIRSNQTHLMLSLGTRFFRENGWIEILDRDRSPTDNYKIVPPTKAELRKAAQLQAEAKVAQKRHDLVRGAQAKLCGGSGWNRLDELSDKTLKAILEELK